MHELIFKSTPSACESGFVRGPCRLPSSIKWPIDDKGIPLFHLVTLPLSWLYFEDKEKFKKENLYISIFISYDKTKFTHYSKMSSDDPDHKQADIILHDFSGPIRNEYHDATSDQGSVILSPVYVESDDDIASYIGGEPSWVQDPIKIDNYEWRASIYGPDIDAACGSNAGLMSDGTGYIFIRNSFDLKKFGSIGKFFLQI